MEVQGGEEVPAGEQQDLDDVLQWDKCDDAEEGDTAQAEGSEEKPEQEGPSTVVAPETESTGLDPAVPEGGALPAGWREVIHPSGLGLYVHGSVATAARPYSLSGVDVV